MPATPLTVVVTVELPAKLADAAVSGSRKPTGTQVSRLPLASVTWTSMEIEKAVPTVVLWMSPLILLMPAAPFWVFCKEKCVTRLPAVTCIEVIAGKGVGGQCDGGGGAVGERVHRVREGAPREGAGGGGGGRGHAERHRHASDWIA